MNQERMTLFDVVSSSQSVSQTLMGHGEHLHANERECCQNAESLMRQNLIDELFVALSDLSGRLTSFALINSNLVWEQLLADLDERPMENGVNAAIASSIARLGAARWAVQLSAQHPDASAALEIIQAERMAVLVNLYLNTRMHKQYVPEVIGRVLLGQDPKAALEEGQNYLERDVVNTTRRLERVPLSRVITQVAKDTHVALVKLSSKTGKSFKVDMCTYEGLRLLADTPFGCDQFTAIP